MCLFVILEWSEGHTSQMLRHLSSEGIAVINCERNASCHNCQDNKMAAMPDSPRRRSIHAHVEINITKHVSIIINKLFTDIYK